MGTALTVAAALIMIILLDRSAKWQMAALASYYTKKPVCELAETFKATSAMQARMMPLTILLVLAMCLVFTDLPVVLLAAFYAAAVAAYCFMLYRGWMAIIKAGRV